MSLFSSGPASCLCFGSRPSFFTHLLQSLRSLRLKKLVALQLSHVMYDVVKVPPFTFRLELNRHK